MDNLSTEATKGEGDKWTNAKALPINSKEYSLRNPSISKDEADLDFHQICQEVWVEKTSESKC